MLTLDDDFFIASIMSGSEMWAYELSQNHTLDMSLSVNPLPILAEFILWGRLKLKGLRFYSMQIHLQIKLKVIIPFLLNISTGNRRQRKTLMALLGRTVANYLKIILSKENLSIQFSSRRFQFMFSDLQWCFSMSFQVWVICSTTKTNLGMNNRTKKGCPIHLTVILIVTKGS